MRLSDRTPTKVRGAGLLRLYPRAWRDRYEPEMLAVLEASRLDWRTRLDLIHGALDAHIRPARAPAVPILAALVAGVMWIVAGVAGIAQPLPPDWPGFLLETLPVGLLGAIAELRVVLAIGRRSGLGGPRGTGVALVFAAVGHVVWIVALAVAAIGGPYGAITGAGQSLAAVGTLAVGLIRARAGDHVFSLALVVAGTAMLVPSPLAWPLAGGAWLALAVAGVRPPVPLSRV
jgi:hypothetical protein